MATTVSDAWNFGRYDAPKRPRVLAERIMKGPIVRVTGTALEKIAEVAESYGHTKAGQECVEAP